MRDDNDRNDQNSENAVPNDKVVELKDSGESFQSFETQNESSSDMGVCPVAFSDIYQKDSYLLFRALCKLSMKGISDENYSTTDSIIHQNK